MDGKWHFRLICQAVRGPASFQATLVASDRFGERALRSFKYSVLENVEPVLSREIAPIALNAVGQSVDIDLSQHFTDEDGEPLDYRVNSLVASTVSAELVDGNKMRITARAFGLGEVRAAVFDAMGATAKCDIPVLVRPAGEKVTVLEGNVFTDKLTILTAEQADHPDGRTSHADHCAAGLGVGHRGRVGLRRVQRLQSRCPGYRQSRPRPVHAVRGHRRRRDPHDPCKEVSP